MYSKLRYGMVKYKVSYALYLVCRRIITCVNKISSKIEAIFILNGFLSRVICAHTCINGAISLKLTLYCFFHEGTFELHWISHGIIGDLSWISVQQILFYERSNFVYKTISVTTINLT